MNTYKIEHKIYTISDCAVMKDKNRPASFSVEEVEFFHWNFNFIDGWKGDDAWLAVFSVDASNYIDAINILWKKFALIIPRVALISQSYIEYIFEPFLIHKTNEPIAFLRFARNIKGGGLMFMENEQEALNKLLNDKITPDSFYYYWNDAVNTNGYSSKLLLMFSALEAFARKRDKKIFPKPKELYIKILGTDLTNEIFSGKNSLRNRLVHGEYFNQNDHKNNYLKLVHEKVISFFNEEILKKKLIAENVVSPQRHPFENHIAGNFFFKRKDNKAFFNLKDILNNFDGDRFKSDGEYEIISGKKLNQTY